MIVSVCQFYFCPRFLLCLALVSTKPTALHAHYNQPASDESSNLNDIVQFDSAQGNPPAVAIGQVKLAPQTRAYVWAGYEPLPRDPRCPFVLLNNRHSNILPISSPLRITPPYEPKFCFLVTARKHLGAHLDETAQDRFPTSHYLHLASIKGTDY